MRRELLSKQFFFRLVELVNAESDPNQRRRWVVWVGVIASDASLATSQ